MANPDGRRIWDRRLEALSKLAKEDRSDPAIREKLGKALAEARLLEPWRARSISNFRTVVEQFLGLTMDEGLELANVGREALGLPDRLSEEEIALWLRAEAALVEAGTEGRVQVKNSRFTIDVPAVAAIDLMRDVARRLGQDSPGSAHPEGRRDDRRDGPRRDDRRDGPRWDDRRDRPRRDGPRNDRRDGPRNDRRDGPRSDRRDESRRDDRRDSPRGFEGDPRRPRKSVEEE
ncbi:MAG: hypothetical protein AAGF12_18485 [Myxococcota bacterium]